MLKRRPLTLLFWSANFMLLLFITGCEDNPPLLKPLNSDATILSFGDSITYGDGVNHPNSYPTQLANLISMPVINAGISGEISKKGLARLPNVLDKHQPDILILCHGGNDILRKLDKNKAADNIRQMIQLAQSRDIDVVLVGVPEFGLILSSAEFYANIAEEFQVPYEAKALSEILSNSTLKKDRVHPNSRGNLQLAQSIATLMKENGAFP